MINLTGKIEPVEKPVQLEQSQASNIGIAMVEVDQLVRATEARNSFNVSGKGLTVAVLDTGLRTSHRDFTGRVISQQNFTSDNQGNVKDASDNHGHGTHVSGIITANSSDRKGMAPEANIIPIKVLDNKGDGDFINIEQGLEWVLNNHAQFKITAICLSLSDRGNYKSEAELFNNYTIKEKIQKLRALRVATIIAAGNHFFEHSSRQGMGYPAIIQEAISVGAVYDENVGYIPYESGAVAYSTGKDRITPFTQRLHVSNLTHYTTIFAPGSIVISSGIKSDAGKSMEGTSQAAPTVAGAVLLIQELYERVNGKLPAIDEVEEFLKRGAVKINDGDDEDDNVRNTDLGYLRLDMVGALKNIVSSHFQSVYIQKQFEHAAANGV